MVVPTATSRPQGPFLGSSQPLALKLLHCTCQPRARGRVDAVTSKETLSGMLGCPGLSHQLPKRIISCSQDESSIGGPSVGSLARLIFDRPGAFDNAYICTLLRSSLNLFPDKAQGCHCLNML